MANHAEGVRQQPESTLILILTPLQTTLLRPALRRMPLRLVLLPMRQHSQGVPELRMPHWDGDDAWQLDCVSFGGASERRVQRWLVDGR
jgi:hypothetical protein